jgi:hypothetical protein
MLQTNLGRLPKDDDDSFKLRQAFQQSLFKLHQAREQGNKNLEPELNAYFEAYEKAAKKINGSKKVGGAAGDGARLRCNQGDARDLMLDILIFLGYENQYNVQFAYNIFTNNQIKILLEPQPPLILLSIPSNGTNLTVEKLYEQWSQPELMTKPNQMRNLNDVAMDSKRYQVIADPPPSSLFFELKRYDYIGGEQKRISTPVLLSHNLVVKAHLRSDVSKTHDYSYKLSAVIIHLGSSPRGGHYYAYVYEPELSSWVKYNDSSVSIVTQKTVDDDARTNAYLLLYQR